MKLDGIFDISTPMGDVAKIRNSNGETIWRKSIKANFYKRTDELHYISSDNVKYEDDAILPEMPQYEDIGTFRYFKGEWSDMCKNMTSDMSTVLSYTPKLYVSYINGVTGGEFHRDYYLSGSQVQYPQPPQNKYHTFKQWNPEQIGYLDRNTVVSAEYSRNQLIVDSVLSTYKYDKQWHPFVVSSHPNNHPSETPTVQYSENGTSWQTQQFQLKESGDSKRIWYRISCENYEIVDGIGVLSIQHNKFTISSFSIPDYYGYVVPPYAEVDYGDSKSFTAYSVSAEYYKFSYWNHDHTLTSNVYTVSNISSNTVLLARFESKKAYITAYSNDTSKGTVEPTIQSVNKGSSATVYASSNPGYQFSCWYKSGYEGEYSRDTKLTLNNVFESVELTAYFNEQQVDRFTVTAYSNDTSKGTVEPASKQVEKGGSASFSASAKTGYHFSNWTGDYTSTQSQITITNITSNMEITANFEEDGKEKISASLKRDGKKVTCSVTSPKGCTVQWRSVNQNGNTRSGSSSEWEFGYSSDIWEQVTFTVSKEGYETWTESMKIQRKTQTVGGNLANQYCNETSHTLNFGLGDISKSYAVLPDEGTQLTALVDTTQDWSNGLTATVKYNGWESGMEYSYPSKQVQVSFPYVTGQDGVQIEWSAGGAQVTIHWQRSNYVVYYELK